MTTKACLPKALQVCLATLAVSCLSGSVVGGSQAASSQTVTVVDYPPPPSTLQEMLRKSPLVLRGKITAAARTAIAQGEEAVHRPYDLQVVEVFRNTPESLHGRTSIKVIQYGGTADIGGRLARTAASMKRVFEVGDELLLFLGPERRDGAFSVLYGDASALWLSASETQFPVNIPQPLRRMAAFEGKTQIGQDKLLDLVRKLSEGR